MFLTKTGRIFYVWKLSCCVCNQFSAIAENWLCHSCVSVNHEEKKTPGGVLWG